MEKDLCEQWVCESTLGASSCRTTTEPMPTMRDDVSTTDTWCGKTG